MGGFQYGVEPFTEDFHAREDGYGNLLRTTKPVDFGVLST
jgi:hypothetical protein